MKFFLFLLIGLWSSFEWYVIEDKAAHFTVAMPNKPLFKFDSAMTDIGQIKIKSYTYSQGEGAHSQIFIVNHTEYPSEFNFDDAADSTGLYISQTIQDQILSQLQGTLMYSSETSFSNISAKLFLLRYGEDSSIVKMAVIPFRNHLVTLQYFSSYQDRLSQDADKYFKSFRSQ